MLDTNTAGIQVNALVSPQGPLSGNATVTTANTNYTTPTAKAVLIATQTRGARLTKVNMVTLANVATAAEVQLYTSPDGGTTTKFLKSVTFPVYTVVQTAGQTPIDFGYSDASPLILQPGESLYAAVGNAQTGILLRAEGGVF